MTITYRQENHSVLEAININELCIVSALMLLVRQ